MKKDNNRIESILVMILLNSLKGFKTSEKALQLSLAGLSNVEIANYLQINSATVANLLYQQRKSKKKI